MIAAISQAAIKQPFKVLGRNLKPFSLWHQLFLDASENGFALGSANKPTYHDLISAVFFCSFDYSAGLEQLASRFIGTKMAYWAWRAGNFDVMEAISDFYSYMEAHTNTPAYWVEDGHFKSGGKSGVPYAQFLKVKMMQELGMSEVEALNTAYNDAIINHLTILEAKGAIRFVTEDDEALIIKARSMEARLQEIAAKVRNN